MNIWNKILVGLIVVLAPVFLYLAIRAVRTHRHWREIAVQKEAELQKEKERYLELLEGTGEGKDATMGTRQYALALHELMVDRGRVWYNCQPQQVQESTEASTGIEKVRVLVKTSLPEPHGISARAVLFVFEQKLLQQGGSYLGQFTVTNLMAGGVQLEASMNMSPPQFERLEASQQAGTPWMMYETMPVDDPAVFAGMSVAGIKPLVGSDTVAKYLADTARTLRDYEIFFREYHRLRSARLDMYAAATRDKQFLDESTADAAQQEQFRRNEIDQLQVELKGVTAEASAVLAHRNSVRNKLAAMRAAADELIQSNRAMAGEIARIQLEATRLIDERTRKMARQLTGTN